MTEAATTKAGTQYTTVTMDDGRIVDFPGKRRLVKESIIGADGKVQVRLDFVNGETRIFTVPDSLMARFAAHGAGQKLGDETASLTDVDDMVLAVDELMERLSAGEWSMKRETSGLAGTSILARALVELSGKSAEQIKAFLATKTQAQKVALRSDPKVAPIVARLEANKAKKPGNSVDTDALLGELN